MSYNSFLYDLIGVVASHVKVPIQDYLDRNEYEVGKDNPLH